MITAEVLKQVTTLGPYALSRLLHTSGYRNARFETAEFVGITNGGEFAYSASFHDGEGTGRTVTAKVYVRYDQTTNRYSAEY
jgi:hypothetical protein